MTLMENSGKQPAQGRPPRIGIWLFFIYVVLYAGFMVLNAFAPQRMAQAPFGGINLAILYGLGLIVAAVVLALLYVILCRVWGERE